MIVALMQPYWFPYIGYFQLMLAADLFVVHDDVQYIQSGFLNRNRILVDGNAEWLTLPVSRGKHQLAINERHYVLDHPLVARARRRVMAAYRHAPNFEVTMTLIDETLSFPDANVAEFNTHALSRVADYLGIDTPFAKASELGIDPKLAGADRVVEICRRLEATHYVNPPGGMELYDPIHFQRHGLELSFLEGRTPEYPQLRHPHVPRLSILDVMMFNDAQEIAPMLRTFRLNNPRH